ncbi:MAG: DNA polymerase/3'-5' exonuclease PolX [Proteobacteria bacterium]|nr:DNA polymerase/3'-5' exonuclease PolX [Pseudomonadota bacterium]
MKNYELAKIFDEMGDILDFLGENPFRVRTYKRASQIIYGLSDDIEILFKSGKLAEIKGIGESILSKVEEFLKTGKIHNYEELKAKVPQGILELLNIPGIGPKGLKALYDNLHITNFDELIKACEDKLVQKLPGFGPKKEENILKGLLRTKEAVFRFPIGLVYEDVLNLLERVREIKGVKRAEVAGSFRRMKETIGDADIEVSGEDGAGIIKNFTQLDGIKEIISEGDTKGSVILHNGLQVDIRVVESGSFGACLQYFTGSKEHNVKLRGIAKEKGFKINEYGIFKGDKFIAGENEEDIYKTLGLIWIPPELREDKGEIELAQAGELEDILKELIDYDDIKGDVHCHSSYSDGGETIIAMAISAKRLGYEYIVITDHSQSLKIAKGLEIERLYKQWEEIDKINKSGELGNFKIFKGTEVDIKSDGALDYPDDVLKNIDFVIASIHSGFRESEQVITKRIIRAMENPYVTAIGHPTGRILNTRDPYNVNLIEIFKKAKETNTFLEINAYFDRLDLNDVNVRIAKEYGVKFVIGTDSHNTSQLKNIRFGIGQARRAMLIKGDVVNTHPLAEFEREIKNKRGAIC